MAGLSRLEKDVNNHHKHFHALILWLKAHKGCTLIDPEFHYKLTPDPDDRDFSTISGNPFDLCDLLSEGSTVAHEIWAKYEDDWKPAEEPAKLPSYIVVIEESADSLAELVNKSFIQGYKLAGNLQVQRNVDSWMYFQPMVRE
jgi:hypothetical protein